MAILGHIFILILKISGSKESKDLQQKLNDEQKKIYDEIKKERRNHYTYGLLIGLIISIMFYLYNKKQMLCVYIGIMTFIANHFYLLMPKKNWMIEHLTEKEDIIAWNKVYRKMRYLTSYSDLIGFIFFAIQTFI